MIEVFNMVVHHLELNPKWVLEIWFEEECKVAVLFLINLKKLILNSSKQQLIYSLYRLKDHLQPGKEMCCNDF